MAKKRRDDPGPIPEGVNRNNRNHWCGKCQGNGTIRVITYNRANEIVSVQYETCASCKGTGLK